MAPMETRYTSDAYLHTIGSSKWYSGPSYPGAVSCDNGCSYPIERNMTTVAHNSSGVTSYRGKPQYVKINGKRKKKYNAFNRWKHWCPTNDLWKFCSNNEAHCYLIVEYAMGRLLRAGSRALINGSQTRFTGDPAYTSCLEGMEVLGEKARKPLLASLHAKANAPLFDGAVFIAELHETIFEIKKILKGPVMELNKVYKDRSFDFTRPYKTFLRNPEEWWLWYRYFLLPAMLSVEDLIDVFTKKHDPITRVQDGIQQTRWYDSSGTLTDNDCHYNQRAAQPVVDISFESSYRYSGGGAIDFHFRHDPHKWGFSAYDLLRATWERTPWSFVLDWFYDVGGWLASWRQIDMEIAQSYATIVVEAETTISGVSPDTWHLAGEEYYSSHLYIDRIIDLEPPLTPCFNNEKLSLNRSIDALSLIIGFFKRVIQAKRR